MATENNLPFLDPTPNGCRIRIKAQPRASKNEIAGIIGDALKVRITAPPVDSAANQAIRDLLAKKLQVPKSAVELVQGGTSRNKIFSVTGLNSDEAGELLL